MDSVSPSAPLRERKATPPQADTPVAVKAAYTADPDLCIDGNRRVMLEELQEEVPQVELDVFFERLLPDLRDDIRLDDVLDKLCQVQPPVLLSSGKWNHFSCPSDFKKAKNKVYSKLVDIIDAIAAAAGIPITQRTLTFQCNANEVPISSTRANNSRPNCVGVLEGTSEGCNEWIYIAVPVEFKTGTGIKEMNDVRRFYISLNPEFVPTPITSELDQGAVVVEPHHARRP